MRPRYSYGKHKRTLWFMLFIFWVKTMIPKETEEQQILSNWLRANNYTFYKSPSETYTTSWKQKRKNTLEWVTRGFPDVTIILKRWSLLFIELKRIKKSLSKVSVEQKMWQDELNKLTNIQAEICYWSDEAINRIIEIENA